ncbi:MAG: allantoinase AllB [Deinococcales bacterium]
MHFNEPGREAWEGIETGSGALVAGGGSSFFDMPLNSHPPLLDQETFKLKERLMLQKSYADFALWGGLTPRNLDKLPELATCGVIGFKAFMSHSGIAEFERADGLDLLEGMRIAADLNLPVAVHAESEALTSVLTERLRAKGETSIEAYLKSRPVIAELEAIERALLFAKDSKVKLHIVHVSSPQGLELIDKAKAEGVNVSAETCSHYLLFNEDDLKARGAILKCAPPLRSQALQQQMWHKLKTGNIDILASDHSPSSLDLKESDDFFNIWGGVAGVEHSFLALLKAAPQHGLDAEFISQAFSFNVAKRFKLATKGQLSQGYDADIAVIDLADLALVSQETQHSRHRFSPYQGFNLSKVKALYIRGQLAFSQQGLHKIKPQRLKIA